MNPYLVSTDADSEITVKAEKYKGIPMNLREAKYMLENLSGVTYGKKGTVLIPDFDERPIFIDPGVDAVIPSNALVVSTDYPYGKHRCIRVIWAELQKNGEWKADYITSAFGGGWNAPKRETACRGFNYFAVNENGYWGLFNFDPVRETTLYDHSTREYTFIPAPIENFLAHRRGFLTEGQIKSLEELHAHVLAKRDEQARRIAAEAETAGAVAV